MSERESADVVRLARVFKTRPTRKGRFRMVLIWPVEQEGSEGEDVRSVQYLVTAHGNSTGVDGIFGSLTKTAVETFQSSHGLSADGIVGPQTWPQLIIEVQQGSNGDAVRAVQSQIHGRGDGAHVAIDGIFGSETDEAVRAFQTLLALSVDGIVGPQTWNYLVNGYLAAPDPQTAAKDLFSAWEANSRGQASKNATPGAVNEIFAQSFSSGASWSFEGCQGAAGHTFCSWKRSDGHELRIGVINAVEGPYYVADQVQFV
jgi:peptidoglycan hydrolase-like protein with peptidoglycan-binding domain